MSFRRLFSTELSQTASVGDYQVNFGDETIDLPGVSDLSPLREEAPQIVKFIRFKIGEPVLTVHMDNSQIFLLFENANLKYSSIINIFQARSWMINYYGLNKDFNVNDLTGLLPQPQASFLKRMTENIAGEISPPVGGNNTIRRAYINMVAGTQDYDIYNDVIDYTTKVPLYQSLTALTGTVNSSRIELKNIYHFPAVTLYRFYDPYSSINLLSQEFNFESFNTESIFYVLPIWTDILRAQQLNMSDKVRRSNYSYEKVGRRLRIFPTPIKDLVLWLDYEVNTNPFPTDGSDPSVSGVSNISNVPLLDIAYDKINPVGRVWIRDYTYALCLETEGRIRRKFDKIPIPNDSIVLDGTAMVQEGFQMQKELEEKLRDDLDKLTIQNIMKVNAEMSDNIEKEYGKYPIPIWMY